MAISMTISTLNSYPSLKSSLIPFKTHKFRNPVPQFTSSSPNSTTQSFHSRLTHAFHSKKFGNSFLSARNNNDNNLGFCLKSKRGESGEMLSEGEIKDLSETSLPDRFRFTPKLGRTWLPYALAILALLIYTRRAVLCEVGKWNKVASIISSFLRVRLKPVFPVAVPIAHLIHLIRDFYRGIIRHAPIGDLTLIIVLASIILAISETAVPDSINSQPYIMTVAGLAGYAAVRNFISERIFWGLLLGIFIFSRLIKRKDNVTSSVPVAAVLVAVGEPWIRCLVMVSFLGLAIFHHWKNPSEEKEGEANLMGNNSLPFPLVCAGLAIGLRVAVNWAGYRHLTWMIV